MEINTLQYKDVLKYLRLNYTDSKYFNPELLNKIKTIYSTPIAYTDIYNYFSKHRDNLKTPGEEEFCLLVAMLLIEKTLTQYKPPVDPLKRISELLNSWLYNKALGELDSFKLTNSNVVDYFFYITGNRLVSPQFIFKDNYTAAAKMCKQKYDAEGVKILIQRYIQFFSNIRDVDYGVIVYSDKTVVIFDTKKYSIESVYTGVDFEQITVERNFSCKFS